MNSPHLFAILLIGTILILIILNEISYQTGRYLRDPQWDKDMEVLHDIFGDNYQDSSK